MKAIKDLRSLRDHGPYSAYCKVCWCPVFALWVDREKPDGKCIHGHDNVRCPESLAASSLLRALPVLEDKKD